MKYFNEAEKIMLRQINHYLGSKVEGHTEGQPWDLDLKEYYCAFSGIKGTVTSTGEVGLKNVYLTGSEFMVAYNNMDNSTPIPFIVKQLERNADSPVIEKIWANINKD
jgi:hypothetical protein